ncbi:hypothetical protein SEPCBS119000_006248 [Sporothrix epigloea]|uniref:F-box domain-containing protein n=1 Tax=Sporothrix epigloea TaxID=1892477 RepID=A0ABP0E671_9PEZI
MAVAHADQSPAPGQDRLSRLPVELLLRIARLIWTADLCAVRQCSRSLERAFHYFFMDGFFRSKQFMLTEYSLQTLLDMARHPIISQTLRHVSFGLEEFRVCHSFYPEDEVQAAFSITAVVEQKALMANGSAVQLLATAFSLLPNLESVQLRDHASPKLYRGRPFTVWRSHGLFRMWEHLSWDSKTLLKINSNPSFSSRVFALVVAALAQSSARPPNLDVLLSKEVNGLHYFAFDLSPAPRLSLHGSSSGGVDGGGDSDGKGNDKFTALSVLAGLRRLHLKLRFSFYPHHGQEADMALNLILIPDGGYTHPACVESLPLRVWLAHCPKLEWLRLNFEDEANVYNDVFLGQLGAPLPVFYPLPPGSNVSRDVTLPFASHLRRLDLGMASCYPNVLLGLLRRLPALEHLSLRRSSLISDDRSPQGTWEGFLKALAEDSLGKQLKKVCLKRLYAATPNNAGVHVRRTHIIILNGTDGIEYKAGAEESMASWLQKVSIEYTRSRWEGDADTDSDSEGIIENVNGPDAHDYGSEDEQEEDEWDEGP